MHKSEIWEFVKVSAGFVQSEGLSQQQRGRTMGPLAAQQKPKLWQLNYFTDKTLLDGPGPRRPGKEMRGSVKGEWGGGWRSNSQRSDAQLERWRK